VPQADAVYEPKSGEPRILGLVPARGGSKRLPDKNLAELGGRTLVRRALDTAVACPSLAQVVLSSDSIAILAEAEGVDGVRAISRPAEVASDTARAYDVVLHALAECEESGPRFDVVAILQCTSPFTEPEDVTGAIDLLVRSGAGSAVSVAPAEHGMHPLKMKRMEGDRLLPLFEDNKLTPTHELPDIWARNGSLYLATRETIDGGDLISDDVVGYRMPRDRSIDIDDDLDLAFAEFLLNRRRG
jgi:CMP-N-acetylneuraminic acid synthetase